MRMVAGLEYAGGGYHGWQSQPAVDTVQARLEKALSAVAATPISVKCAGRTDKGVHASGQVFHFDTDAIRTERAWMEGTNHHLPKDIRLLWIQPSLDTFHARYSATARRYRYFLFNAPRSPAFLKDAVSWDYRPLSVERMHEAAQWLVGEHDFSSFRGAGCQAKGAVRRVHQIQVARLPSGLIMFDITANAFLLHMVRNIVGSLMEVGSGEAEPEWIQTVLAARDRRKAGMTASAAGLYLVDVLYPIHFGLPKLAIGPWCFFSLEDS